MTFDDAVIWLRTLRFVNPLFDEMDGWDPPDFASVWAEGEASGKARIISWLVLGGPFVCIQGLIGLVAFGIVSGFLWGFRKVRKLSPVASLAPAL